MKKICFGFISAIVLTLAFTQGVLAWTSVFDSVGKKYEFSKSVTGKKAYQSIMGLRKLTSDTLEVQLILYKKSGLSWRQVGKDYRARFVGEGILNQSFGQDVSNSGTTTYKGVWKQKSAGTMNASLDITNYIPY